ncbi:MAG: transcriptional repressor [Gemmatimonadetes bacterium]|nr:transcriptional repressor [Gemmatimonadota bacterium]
MESPQPGSPDDCGRSEPNQVDWRQVGLRRTPQREVVLCLVRSCYEHPTADWIHQEARKRLPDISLATVYRTLRLLKEKGLIHEFSGGASPSRFDGTIHDPHEHVRCVRCGAVADVELPEATQFRRMVAERTGFRIGRYPLLFHGFCGECARKAKPADATGAVSPDPDDPDHNLAGGYW